VKKIHVMTRLNVIFSKSQNEYSFLYCTCVVVPKFTWQLSAYHITQHFNIDASPILSHTNKNIFLN